MLTVRRFLSRPARLFSAGDLADHLEAWKLDQEDAGVGELDVAAENGDAKATRAGCASTADCMLNTVAGLAEDCGVRGKQDPVHPLP